MAFASRCPCGNSTFSYGGLCDRCVALQTLGLDMNASDAQIEKSYRTLVKVWHPDRFQTDPKLKDSAEEKLKEINSAHEFLLTGEGVRPQGKSKPSPPPEVLEKTEAEPLLSSADEKVQEADESGAGLETPEIRRILKRQRRRSKMMLPKFLLQLGFLFGAVATIAVLWLVVDAVLSSNSRTAGPWEQYKAELARDLHASELRLWSNATESMRGQNQAQGNGALSAPAPAANASNAQTANPPEAPPSAGGAPNINRGAGHSAEPYVTSGLTPMEVLAILGNPTSSSGEKMFYKDAEIDFRNGRVAGWRVDPKKSPIRVKLWPSATPVPGLTQFALGSSKSDVIALQGTPTLFSDNKFGYGTSVVFFQNDRVVGWKEDPNSVRLRVAH